MRTRPSARWVVFGAMAFVYFSFGVMVMSIAPLVSTVRADLGLSRSAMGAALGAWPLIYVFTAPLAGRVIDRVGLRRSLFVGALFVAASGFARAAAQGAPSLWLAIGVFGIGGPLVSTSAPKLVAVWFTDAKERRVAVGAYSAAPSLGFITSLLLANSVLLPAVGSWRGVLVIDAVLALVAGTIWLAVTGVVRSAPRAEVAAAPVTIGREWGQLVRRPGVRYALALGVGTFFLSHALHGWLPDVLEETDGLAASTASRWVAGSIAVGIPASLLLVRLADPRRHRHVLIGVLCVTVACLVAVAFGPSGIDLVATLGLGVRDALVPLTVIVLLEAEGVTSANIGSANGLWFSVSELGGVLGPLTVGLVADSAAGFNGGLTVLVAVAVLMTVSVGWHGAGRSAQTAEPVGAVVTE
jgi:cyanate permease